MSDAMLARYVESEDRGERSVLFLRIYAAKIRAGTELTWEIPNTRASTVEQVANYLAELRASLTAVSAEKEKAMTKDETPTINDVRKELARVQANLDISRRGLPVPADYELAVLKIANEQLVIARDTEQALHAAWEKRAYEAELALAAVSRRLAQVRASLEKELNDLDEIAKDKNPYATGMRCVTDHLRDWLKEEWAPSAPNSR